MHNKKNDKKRNQEEELVAKRVSTVTKRKNNDDKENELMVMNLEILKLKKRIRDNSKHKVDEDISHPQYIKCLKTLPSPLKISQTNIWANYQTKNDAKEVFGKVKLDDVDTKFIYDFSCQMSRKYLESTFVEYKFDNNGSTDGSIMFINDDFETLLLNMEVKPEIGPWLGVSGAAYTKKAACGPLTPMMPLFVIPQSSTSYNEEYGLMHQTACVLHALKNKLANLKEWYEDFQHKIPKITATRSSQLHFPYINFITIKGETFELTYNQELPSHHLVFEATAQNIASSRDIKKRVALTSEKSRQQQHQQPSSNRSRSNNDDKDRQTMSSSDDDNGSDEIDDDSEPGQQPCNTGRSNLSLSNNHKKNSSRRFLKDNNLTLDFEKYLVDIKEVPNPARTVETLTKTIDIFLMGHKDSEVNQHLIDALYREWIPKYALVLLNRSYSTITTTQGNSIANIISMFLIKVLDIAIHLIRKPEEMNVNHEEFPLSEIMQDAIYRILGDENAPFYRRFDSRFDSRRLDVGVNTVMMGIVGENEEIAQCVQNHIRNIPEEWLIRQDKKLIPNIVHMVTSMILTLPSSIAGSIRDYDRNYHQMLSSDEDDDEVTDIRYREVSDEQQILIGSQLKIDIAARLLKTSRLDLRLTGLNEIKEALLLGLKQAKFLKKYKRRTNNSRKRSLSIDGEDDNIPLEEDNPSEKIHRFLNEKLREHQILEYIFGSNIHLEIVQRSTDILTFLIHTKSLTSHELDIIWAPFDGNQHRSIVHGVCQVLIDISDHLNQEQRDYLIQKLMKMPTSFIETQTYLLIRTLVQSTMSSTRTVPHVSFKAHQLLWRLLCESSISIPALMNSEVSSPTTTASANTLSPVSSSTTSLSSTIIDQDIAQNACQVLTNLLQGDTSQEDRNTLLEMCIECLRKHDPGTMWALRLLTRIISPPFPNQELTTNDYLKHLISSMGLPQLFLDDLEHWSKTVRACAGKLNDKPNVLNLDLPSSKMSILRDQLISRLQFIQWIANFEVPFFTSTAQTDIIWNCLIANAIGKKEQDEAFASLDNILEYDYFTEHFFNNRFAELDVRFMSDQAFKYAKNCLLKVNAKNGRLLQLGILIQGDLTGIDLIWDIALRAEEEATDKKLENYANLARQHREALVDKCVKHLFAAANGLSKVTIFPTTSDDDVSMTLIDESSSSTPLSPSMSPLQSSTKNNKSTNALKFKRCLEVLKSFMDIFDTKYSNYQLDKTDVRRHGMLNDGEMITVKVTITNRCLEIQVHPSETVLALRQKIASRIGEAKSSQIRLITAGKEVCPESNGLTLKKLKIVDRQSFMAMKRNNEGKFGQENDRVEENLEELVESDLPINVLSKYIDQFFQMLELEETYSSQIWDLLMRLPTNNTFLNALKTLETPVNWDDLLVLRSPFRLLYALQIVDWLLRGGDDERSQSGSDWCMRFTQNQGLDYLIKLFITLDTTERSSSNTSVSDDDEVEIKDHHKILTKKACLGLLLKIISFFAIDNTIESADIFKSSDSKSLISKLIEIIGKCVDPSQNQVEDDLTIIRHSMKLLSCLCLRDESAISIFVGHPNLREWLISALVGCQSEEARSLMANMILCFCKDINNNIVNNNGMSTDESMNQNHQVSISPVLDQFSLILWSFLPDVENHVYTSKEYFDLMGELMPFITKSSLISLSSLYNGIKNQIKLHPIQEQFNSSCEDTVIIGLLKLMTILVSEHKEFKNILGDGLLEMIFYDCLFEVPNINHSNSLLPPKCKLEVSRNAALKLLNVLVHECPENFVRLTDLYLKQLDRGEQLNDNWNYCPKSCQKSVAGYVGLQNLGATCYVNSIVQQFFMNSDFRKSLLAAPVNDENKDDSLLYQLQIVFGYLQESEKKAFEATQFCHAYKDYDGQPLNVALQMDVDEYFNGLFDRLENSVSGTPYSMLLKEHFGGTIVQQIKSKSCGHISEKEESFFAIQCEVKNKKNVEESLEHDVEGELLDGDNQYFCAKCGKSVDAIKRSCIKKLPKNLIMHLKRFDFDMELLKRVKINEYFEFPNRINMEPYTLDYLIRKELGGGAGVGVQEDIKSDKQNKSQFEYELVGVLVHTGTADSGHYYSFIKERKSAPSSSSSHESDEERRWYQFNDSTVEIFDPKDIPKQCFGGPEYVSQWDPAQQKNVTRVFAKQYNAYMLFYERCEDVQNITSYNEINKQENQIVKVPDDIYGAIWDENIGFLQDKNIFDPGYFNLMWTVLHSVDFDNEQKILVDGKEIDLTMRTIQLASEFVLGTLSRAKDNMELKDWTDFLKTLFQTHLPGCQWFINRLIDPSPNYLQQILMSCYVQEVKEQIVDLIVFVLRTLRQGDPIVYGLESEGGVIDMTATTNLADEISMNIDPSSSTSIQMCHNNGLIVKLCEAMFNLIPTAHLWWRNFEQYFSLMYLISYFGVPERNYMIKRGFIGELVKLFLMDEITPLKSRKRKMGDKFSLPPFRYLLMTLRTLISGCDVSDIGKSGRSLLVETQSTAMRLTEQEISMIFERNESDDQFIFFMKQIRDCIDPPSTGELFAHFATNNEHLSEEFLSQLIRAADIYTVDHVRPHLEIIYSLTQIQDNLLKSRIDYTIPEILKLAKANQSAPQISSECLGLIEALCTSSVGAYVQTFLVTYLSDWLPEYFLYSPYELVRQRAEELFNLLIFRNIDEAQGSQAQLEAIETMHKQYLMLLKHMEHLETCWKTTSSRRGVADPFGWRLSNYFRILTKCVRSNKEKQMEIINFWYTVCEDYPPNIEAIVKNQELLSHLFMYYVSINHSNENIIYNQASLPKYYGLILLCCRHSPECHQAWMEATNFFWALNSMIFGDFYDDHKTDELLELLKMSADESALFRSRNWDQNASSLANMPIIRIQRYLNEENVLKCMEMLHAYLHLACSLEEGKEYVKAWKTRLEFAASLLTSLHPNMDNKIYLKTLDILCLFLKMKCNSELVRDCLKLLIEEHSKWQNRLSSLTKEDLLLNFGGNQSIFQRLKLFEEETESLGINSSNIETPSIHFFRPFLLRLQQKNDIIHLQNELYKPYFKLIEQLAFSGIEIEEFDKVVRLCSLIVLEMLEMDVSNIFNILLDLFEKLSENKNVVSAYNQLAFSMLLEHLLNSNPRLLLTMLPAERFNTFKSLINIVKINKSDVIQPIMLKYIQQFVANVKVLKEKLEVKDLVLVHATIEELLMILRILIIILSDNDLSADDPLTKIYLESLKDILNLEQAKTIIGEHIENIDEYFNKINQLSTQLMSLQVLVVQPSDKDGNIVAVVGAINENENNKNNGDNEEIIGENIIVEENLGIKENFVGENNNNISSGEDNNVEMVISGEDDEDAGDQKVL
nr:13478_t:CDS:10 [Entrophospora candida]